MPYELNTELEGSVDLLTEAAAADSIVLVSGGVPKVITYESLLAQLNSQLDIPVPESPERYEITFVGPIKTTASGTYRMPKSVTMNTVQIIAGIVCDADVAVSILVDGVEAVAVTLAAGESALSTTLTNVIDESSELTVGFDNEISVSLTVADQTVGQNLTVRLLNITAES